MHLPMGTKYTHTTTHTTSDETSHALLVRPTNRIFWIFSFSILFGQSGSCFISGCVEQYFIQNVPNYSFGQCAFFFRSTHNLANLVRNYLQITPWRTLIATNF